MITVNDMHSIEWRNGMTVSEALKKMNYDYSLIVTTVNGQCVSQEEYDFFKIPDNSDVKMIHICHGG